MSFVLLDSTFDLNSIVEGWGVSWGPKRKKISAERDCISTKRVVITRG